MWLDKAETWSLAQELGGEALVEIILEHTHTCYESERGPREAWGHGCGACPACALRKRGYMAWREGRKVV
jgi:7-cyano-7-deazaguanine synthase